MQKITLTVGVLALTMFIDPQPGQAWYDGPWCGYERAGKGLIISRCDLRSYEACRAWINAQPGSWCTENPHYRAEQPARRKAKKAAY
jgi:hypothetical protein